MLAADTPFAGECLLMGASRSAVGPPRLHPRLFFSLVNGTSMDSQGGPTLLVTVGATVKGPLAPSEQG